MNDLSVSVTIIIFSAIISIGLMMSSLIQREANKKPKSKRGEITREDENE